VRKTEKRQRHQKCGWGVNAAVAEKKDIEIKSEIKPADQITSVDISIGDFATIYGKCKAAVEDIYGTKTLTQEHIAAVNTLFIQVSKDKYFKERSSTE
jgi:hypothetical protein